MAIAEVSRNMATKSTCSSQNLFKPRSITKRLSMDFDLKHVKQYLEQKHSQIQSRKRHLQATSEESRQLQSYGKSLFEYAISEKKDSVGIGSRNPRRPVTCGTIPSGLQAGCVSTYRRNSGPTRHGSIIYNKKSLVLNDIRNRPATVQITGHVQSSKYNHLPELCKTPSFPYRLKVTDLSGEQLKNNGHIVDLSGVLLLPDGNQDSTISEFLNKDIDPSAAQDESLLSVEPPRTNYRKPSIPVLVQIDAADSSEGESENNFNVSRNSERRNSSRGSLRGSARSTGRTNNEQRKKSPSTAGRESNKTKNVDTLSPSSTGRRPASGGRGRLKGKTTGGRERKVSPGGKNQRNVREESPTRLQLPGPHCWVDDITVSSDIMGCEEGQAESVNSFTNIPRLSGNRCSTPVSDKLPPFVCPSSEQKSKNVATKRWIRDSYFSVANRAVPLL